MRRQIGCAVLVSAAAIAIGCAGFPPPVDTIAAADVAVSDAQRTDIQKKERLELHIAREHLTQARAALEAERNEEALMLAQKALVEAQLAAARAEARGAQQNVAEIRDHVEVLRREIERDGGRRAQ